MTVEQFAKQYRVKMRRDSCGEEIIPGKKFCRDMPDRMEYRSHVYDHGDGARFGVCLLFTSVGKWHNAAKRLLAAGFTLKQNGDTEGTLLFDPTNATQAKAALKGAGVKTRRKLTSEQLTALMAREAKTAFGTPKTARSGTGDPKPMARACCGFETLERHISPMEPNAKG